MFFLNIENEIAVFVSICSNIFKNNISLSLIYIGLLNRFGVDLENDFAQTPNSGKARQPETSSVMEWLEQRSFLFGLELRGEDENFIVPLQNQGGQQQTESLRLALL